MAKWGDSASKERPRKNKTQEVKEKTTCKDRKCCIADTRNKLSGPRGKQEDVGWMRQCSKVSDMKEAKRGFTMETDPLNNTGTAPTVWQADGWMDREGSQHAIRAFPLELWKIFHIITGNSIHQGIMLVSLHHWERETWINIANGQGHLETSVAF